MYLCLDSKSQVHNQRGGDAALIAPHMKKKSDFNEPQDLYVPTVGWGC